MTTAADGDSLAVTALLHRASAGDKSAEGELFDRLYAELHADARRQMRNQRPWHTLRSTALVNEAYSRLFDRQPVAWQGRTHFLKLASRAMHCVLVDHARGKSRLKRQPPERPSRPPPPQDDVSVVDLIALDDALVELAKEDARCAEVVELRFFGGLSMPEIAGVLDVPLRTVERDWKYARVHLRRILE